MSKCTYLPTFWITEQICVHSFTLFHTPGGFQPNNLLKHFQYCLYFLNLLTWIFWNPTTWYHAEEDFESDSQDVFLISLPRSPLARSVGFWIEIWIFAKHARWKNWFTKKTWSLVRDRWNSIKVFDGYQLDAVIKLFIGQHEVYTVGHVS